MLLVFLKMQVKETLCKRSLWTVREAITSINSESFSSWAVTAKVEMHLNLTKYTYTWSEAGWIFPLMISATEKRVMTICPQQLSQAAVSRCQGGDNHEINSKQFICNMSHYDIMKYCIRIGIQASKFALQWFPRNKNLANMKMQIWFQAANKHNTPPWCIHTSEGLSFWALPRLVPLSILPGGLMNFSNSWEY